MSEAEARSEDPRVEALHRRMAGYSLGGHWQHREQAAPLVPFVWTWDSIYECLMESGEVITLGHAGDAANRRTVQLVNPAITAQKSTTRTLQMSIQLVKPGELAECHRHSAAALRFIVESDGKSYTNVDGEQMLMEPGDLVLTPNWTWHDHHNPSETNVVWLDVLDVHLAKYLDAMYGETYSQGDAENANYFEGASQTVVHPDGYCRQRFGVARPPRDQVDARFVPYNYKWRDTLADRRADHADHQLPGADAAPGRGDAPPQPYLLHHLSRGRGRGANLDRRRQGRQQGTGLGNQGLLLRPVQIVAQLQEHLADGCGTSVFGERPPGS
jgi:gentisate 1,2-dioxygenase